VQIAHVADFDVNPFESLWDSLQDSLWDSLGESLGSSLRASLGESSPLWSKTPVRKAIAALWSSLRDSLWSSLRDSLWSSLWDSLGESLWDSLGESHFFGQQDSYWIAYYLFASEVLGVRYDRAGDLALWAEIAQSCGWWWPYRGLCVVADRPAEVHWDQQASPRLHCATGPALAFRDGWKVYAWHGTRVPAEWIDQPDRRNPRLALTWPNIEQRRALAEMIGWERILQDLHPTVVDQDPDPQVGTLLRVDLPDSPKEYFLKVRCGTGRTFCLPVPPCKTALEANASTFDVPPEIIRHLETRT
jgi:hypothetical protein